MAVRIDASTENISIADNAKWDFTPVTQARTLTCFWRSSSLPNVDGEYQVLFRLNNSAGNKLALQLFRTSGTLLMFGAVYNSVYTNLGYFYAIPTLSANTWYHLAYVLSTSGNCICYVNGSPLSTTHSSWDDSTAISATEMLISNGVAIYDNMDVCHWKWWTGAQTSTVIGQDQSNPWQHDSNSNVLCSLHMYEGTGTTVYDWQTGNTRTNGTLVNSPTWVGDPTLRIPVSIAGSNTFSGAAARKYKAKRAVGGSL